jgi:golgi phosphoprotein 3
MNSASSGLVRRRTAAETSSSDYNNSTSNNDHNDNFKDDADEDNIEETSDKETRLTLMEEVLLLGLKDKEVSFAKKQLQCWHFIMNIYKQCALTKKNRK